MKCLIVSGGFPPSKKLIKQQLIDSDLLIGVDGAADFLTDCGITADVVVGDFDTAKKINVLNQQNSGAEVIRLQTNKDETDTEAAVNIAIERGAKNIVLLGALGSRQDHTLANIALLKQIYDRDAFAKIIDDETEMFICDSEISLHAKTGQTLSILALYGDISVTAKGLEYPLDDLALPFGSSRGVSNIVNNSPVSIRVFGGFALIILSNGSL